MEKFRIYALKQKINENNHVILYGAGNLAKETIKELKKNNIIPELCIVSNKRTAKINVKDIPIYSINESEEFLRKTNSLVIIAVTKQYQREIEDILQEHCITNYIFVTDYIWIPLEKDSYENIYKNKSIDWYLDRISEWEIDNSNIKLDKFELYKNLEVESNPDTIILCVHLLEPRVIKIGSELKRKGKNVIVLLQKQCKISVSKEILQDLFDNCSSLYCWEYVEEFLALVLQKKAAIIHVFSAIMDQYISCILIQLKIKNLKVVFENYDIANGMYKYEYVDKYFHDLERYCIENADGVCCRGFEIDFLTNNLNFQIKGKLIKFFDYCFNEECIELNKDCNRPLSLCYAGTFTMEEEGTGASHACYSELIKLCEENKCHLHIYPVNWDKDRFKKYIDLGQSSEYFHFHKPVSFLMLRRELAQYDFGIFGEKREYIDKNTDKRLTPNKYIYAATNKYFSYLDAGLPIIAKGPEKFLKLFEERNVVFKWTIEEYDFNEMIHKRDQMHKSAVLARKELAIENKIDELINFYKSLTSAI